MRTTSHTKVFLAERFGAMYIEPDAMGMVSTGEAVGILAITLRGRLRCQQGDPSGGGSRGIGKKRDLCGG